MNKINSLKKALDKILAKEASDFQLFETDLESDLAVHQIEDFDLLDLEDREVFARFFLKLGDLQITANDAKFLDSFAKAIKIVPNSYAIFFLQGSIFLKYSHNLQYLSLSKKAFEKALEIEPKSFEALYAIAKVLNRQGLTLEEAPFFQDAINRLEEAEFFIEEKQTSEFYFEFGLAWFYLGKLSGEAMDFCYALDKYKKASSAGMNAAFFWNAYGDAMIEMAFLVGKKEYFFEAIECYQQAVNQEADSFEAHFNLACAVQCVFEITVNLDYFEQANTHFEKASKIEAFHAALWLKWGQLLASLGKLKREITYLELSIEKFIEADSLEANHPGILSRWGEAEMLLGANKEQINYLRQAEEKLIRSLEINPDAPEIWYLYGICLNELGRYFTDESFYKLAIQKFQYGLSLTESDPLLWYGLAMSHFALGDLLNDQQMIEKSVRFCGQVFEFGGHIFLQFWNDWAISLMRLAEMTLNPQYLESAIEKFEYIIKNHTDSEEVDVEWLYNYGCALDMYGDCHEDINSYEKAVQILSNVIRIDPGYSHARYNLALALSHLGEAISDVECLQKASEHFEILLSEDLEDEMAWNDWGLCLLHQGELLYEPCRPEQSLKIYEKAEKNFFHALSFGCLPAYYNLACLYALNSNFNAAMHYMEKAETARALPPIEDIMHDDWLDGLRQTDAFKAFISTVSNKPRE